MHFTIASDRVVTPDGVRPAAVEVRDALIEAVHPLPHPGAEHVDGVLLPGVVDTHVHVNEPGRTDWEGFLTAGRAAAAGGVTTLVDMPLNSSPVTTDVPALERKRIAAAEHCTVDFGFWGGVVPGNTGDLRPLVEEGVLGFKCFLVPSGIDEFPHVDEPDLREAMPVLAALGVPLLVHGELQRAGGAGGAGEAEQVGQAEQGGRQYGRYLASRPAAMEVEAIDMMIRLSRETGCRVHIVHLACAEGVDLIRAARRDGVRVTVETCPHYLTFAAEDIPDGATEFKCAPPIRTGEVRDALWAGLSAGVIDLVATDHSPCPPAMKCRDTGDFMAAWGGIASLQVSLPAVWTGMRARGLALHRLAEWLSAAPARLAGLVRKGEIVPGRDADLVLFDPDTTWTVDGAALGHRHPVTPYHGRTLTGTVRRTWVRGHLVHDDGAVDPEHRGHWMKTEHV